MERAPEWPGRTVPGGLTVAQRWALLRRGTVHRYRRGECLLSQGEQGACVIVLHSGQARVVATTKDGQRVLLGIRVAGDIVGEMSFVDNQPRRASVIASERVVATTIDNRTLSEFLRCYPETWKEIALALAAKLRVAERRLVATDATTRIVYALAEVVARICEAHVDDRLLRTVDILLTQRELGQLAFAAEVSVQRALRRLRQRGLVRTAYGRVVVCDPEAILTEAGMEARTRHSRQRLGGRPPAGPQ